MPTLRAEVARAAHGFRVSNVRTQAELVAQHTIRERMLAILGTFFAVLALLLAGVGLHGVFTYSVLRRRGEIAIRMAIGAQAHKIAWGVTTDTRVALSIGAAMGAGLGLASRDTLNRCSTG